MSHQARGRRFTLGSVELAIDHPQPHVPRLHAPFRMLGSRPKEAIPLVDPGHWANSTSVCTRAFERVGGWVLPEFSPSHLPHWVSDASVLMFAHQALFRTGLPVAVPWRYAPWFGLFDTWSGRPGFPVPVNGDVRMGLFLLAEDREAAQVAVRLARGGLG